MPIGGLAFDPKTRDFDDRKMTFMLRPWLRADGLMHRHPGTTYIMARDISAVQPLDAVFR
jgi:hypothetical protein